MACGVDVAGVEEASGGCELSAHDGEQRRVTSATLTSALKADGGSNRELAATWRREELPEACMAGSRGSIRTSELTGIITPATRREESKMESVCRTSHSLSGTILDAHGDMEMPWL